MSEEIDSEEVIWSISTTGEEFQCVQVEYAKELLARALKTEATTQRLEALLNEVTDSRDEWKRLREAAEAELELKHGQWEASRKNHEKTMKLVDLYRDKADKAEAELVGLKNVSRFNDSVDEIQARVAEQWQARAEKVEEALREIVQFVEAWKAGEDSELHAMAVIEATARAALSEKGE